MIRGGTLRRLDSPPDYDVTTNREKTAADQRSHLLLVVTSQANSELVFMVGPAACGSVSSIKALWETRIKKIQEEDKKQRRREVKGGATCRSDSASTAYS